MIIFIDNKSTKFGQITLRIKIFIHKRKVVLFSASRCIFATVACYGTEHAPLCALVKLTLELTAN